MKDNEFSILYKQLPADLKAGVRLAVELLAAGSNEKSAKNDEKKIS